MKTCIGMLTRIDAQFLKKENGEYRHEKKPEEK